MKWTRYDPGVIESIPEPGTSRGALAQGARSILDKRRAGDQTELKERSRSYKAQVGWGEFENRPTKQERLAQIDRYLDEANAFMNDNKQHISKEIWTTYNRFSEEAANSKKDAISEYGNYAGSGTFKFHTEKIMGMARQLKDHLEWNKNIDEEKARIASTIDPAIRSKWETGKKELYDRLVSEGQEEIERFRMVSPDRRDESKSESIRESYVTDIKVKFGLLKDNEWTGAFTPLAKRVNILQKEAKVYINYCQDNKAFDRMEFGVIRSWFSGQLATCLSIVEKNRDDTGKFSSDDRRQSYNQIDEIAINFKSMRDILAAALRTEIPPSSAELSQFGIH
jgi:hypothetical protein